MIFRGIRLIIITLTGIIFLLAFGFQAVLAAQMIEIDTEILNVRSEPDTSQEKIGQVKMGQQFAVQEEKNGWFKIIFSGDKQGWVIGTYVKVIEQSPEPAETENTPAAVKAKGLMVTASTLNVRSGPSLDAERICTVPYGTRINYLGSSGDWYQVSLADGRKGWVAGWLVAFSSKAVSSWKYQDSNVPVLRSIDDKEDSTGAGVAGKTIVIDPGHGSTKAKGWPDPGAIGPSGMQERDVVLDIAEKLEDMLEDAGAKVVMTRNEESDISLEGRAALANDICADVFISIHANSAPSSVLNGTTTYFYAPSDSELAFQREERKRLAECVQNQLLKYLDRADLGVREKNLAVLRCTTVPSILVETAFISNLEEEELLGKSRFRRKAAQGIFDGLEDYFAGK